MLAAEEPTEKRPLWHDLLLVVAPAVAAAVVAEVGTTVRAALAAHAERRKGNVSGPPSPPA